jgi:microcompartment protein CcmK/EutM
MMLARVVGRVWATAKDQALDGKKMLVIQPLDPHLRPQGKRLIALDAVGAGAGETVYWCRGKEASFPWLPAEVPTECTIVGIVDRVNVSGH